MIDFEEMKCRHQEGVKQVDSLKKDEGTVLMRYCSLVTAALLRTGAQRNAPVNEVVVNACKNGIALGLRLTVAGGEIRGRQ
ncbi:MAG: hypothetical protein AUK00_01700 [Dehalococcoidia bacterium CG2_30_46_9]|nr:MAG: hypothetical protein AUK00_01700 [Dehalococcoidia bacterium CG2_30_46_9]